MSPTTSNELQVTVKLGLRKAGISKWITVKYNEGLDTVWHMQIMKKISLGDSKADIKY